MAKPFVPQNAEEGEQYRSVLSALKDAPMTREEKIATARAAVKWMGEHGQRRPGPVSRKQVPVASPSVGDYEQQRRAWEANPSAPMPGPLINPAPMARPLDYEEQLRKERMRQHVFGRMGMF